MHRKKPREENILDNFILMRLWCKDENCHKTLGEMLPIYKEYTKKHNKLYFNQKETKMINLNFDTVICPLCYTKFNKSLASTPLSYMHACPHCSAYIDDGYFTKDAQKKLAKHLEKTKGENK